jgi:hypothetical protein
MYTGVQLLEKPGVDAMPARPRKEVVLPGEVAVYHCYARCVRRAFLCGDDPLSGKNYDHRREWAHAFGRQLAALFAVEVGFHAEMSNHLHLVLRTRPDVAQFWSDEEVVRRCLVISRLVRSPDGSSIKEPTALEIAVEVAQPGRVGQLRERLSSLSSFMGALCEYMARRSNAEDDCSGRFWEGRFGCRRLENEAAILICGIYVDLNQIWAGEALTPEQSTHTSAHDRIEAWLARRAELGARTGAELQLADNWLCELTLDERAAAYTGPEVSGQTGCRASDKGLLPIRLEEYLELLDWTGRTVREGKSGAIPAHLDHILDRLKINTRMWTELVTRFDRLFGHIVGSAEQLAASASVSGRRWFRGIRNCRAAFG